ncbi:hypothetical protein Trydic_g18631, partial [Trypoxylus dichotomus]
ERFYFSKWITLYGYIYAKLTISLHYTMAFEEKLFKSLENLRITSEYSADISQRNKEKVQNCTFVADMLANPIAKTFPNFHHLLTTSFETLFQVCNDPESDVRLVAEESLNKIIKATDNENMNRVLMEVHKEIKRNGPARCLKSALWRFSILADLIRLPKRKQYLTSLIPCIVILSGREEDLIHEALVNCFPKILKSLGSFLSDNDVKTLLSAFLNNVGDASAVIRRASSNCLLTVCINCRKPYQSLFNLLDTLLDMSTTTAGAKASVFLAMGILSCLRMLIPHIRQIDSGQEIQGSFGITRKTKVVQIGKEKFAQVYRLCLHFLLCEDDSVTGAALDTLSALFQNCTSEFRELVLSTNGLGNAGRRSSSFPARLYNLSGVPKSAFSDDRSDTGGHHTEEEMTAAIRVRDVKELSCGVEALDIGSSDDKDVALIFCTRLVCKLCLLSGRPAGIVPDGVVRISVKSSALACLASLFAIYPQGFLLRLSKRQPPSDRTDTDPYYQQQPISDVMLLANHSDPQLRGAIRSVVASFVRSALLEANASNEGFDGWLQATDVPPCPNGFGLDRLLAFVREGLLDVSSNCVRQSLASLITCVNYVLLSSDCLLVLPVLQLIPAIAHGSHWLVKVKVLEVIEQLPFPLIDSMGGATNFRDQIVFDVVFDLVADDDQRVRTIAAKTVVRIVPLLYYGEGRRCVERAVVERGGLYFRDKRLRRSAATACGEEEESTEETAPGEDKILVKIFCDDLPFPFDAPLRYDSEEDHNVTDALSTIVSVLRRRLETNFATDSTIAGYVEALSRLSSKYPTTVYQRIWGVGESCQTSLLSFVGCLLDNELIYDIDCHAHVLRLYGNLFAGMCVHELRRKDVDGVTMPSQRLATAIAAQRPLWRTFGEGPQQEICESFLNHTIKLLNVFVHVIEDTSLTELKPPSANSNPTISSGASSPLKAARRTTIGDVEKASGGGERKTDDDDKGDKKNEPPTTTKALGMGYFANSAHYVKIYHQFRIAYVKYKATLHYDEQPANIVTLLGVLLESLGQILEIATMVETSRIAEELLSYLQTVFYLEPAGAVSCVHQLLKSLFGSNLVSRADALKLLKRKAATVRDERIDDGLRYAFRRYHYDDLYGYFRALRRTFEANVRSDTPPLTWMMAYPHRTEMRQAAAPAIKSDKMLANYIRLFEPMVIRSLKDYTITSNVDVQCAVLRLLNQLVRLKVNYCLLDSEQVFIKFIQKQFEYIEEGLMAHPERIIPKMFEFLMNLSHGKQHSKSIIGVPKVIQLCDGLMACGQAPLGYCIPALRPIVENVFLLARQRDYGSSTAAAATATADFSELEITREFLMSMLLRLFEYAQVMDLLRAILNDARRTDKRQPIAAAAAAADRWSKYSRQMFDVFFAKLADDKLKLDNRNDTLSLMKWLIVLHPTVFRLPTIGERLLAILFRNLPSTRDSVCAISRWLGRVTIILTIVVQLREDALLKAVKDSLRNFSPEAMFDQVSVGSDPLNVASVGNNFENLDAGAIFVRFTFRVFELVAARCALAIRHDEDARFLIEQLSHVLFVCSRVYRPAEDHQSFLFETAASLIADDNSTTSNGGQYRAMLERINASFLVINRSFPFVVYQWCRLLTSLDRRNSTEQWIHKFMVLDEQDSYGKRRRPHRQDRLNLAISASAALISFCQHLNERNDCSEESSALIEVDRLFRLAIQYCDEAPVAEALLSVQRDAATSALFVEKTAAEVRSQRLEPCTMIRLLDLIQDCHGTQTGSSILLLIESLLNCRHLAVLRTVVNLTCRKLEYLLTFDVPDIKRQIRGEDLRALTDRLVENKLAGRNETLLGLLGKLGAHIYDGNASEHLHHHQHRRRVDVSHIRNLEINKSWYLKRLVASKIHVYEANLPPNWTAVFRRIDAEDVAGIDDEGCRKFVLRSVLRLSRSTTNNDGGDSSGPVTDELSSLLRLATRMALDDMIRFFRTLPRRHQVYMPESRIPYPEEEAYAQELNAVFRADADAEWQKNLIELTATAADIARSFDRIGRLEDERCVKLNFSLVVRLCVVCAESFVYRLLGDDVEELDPNVEHLESILLNIDAILAAPEAIRVLSLDAHRTWLCSFVNFLYKLVDFLAPDSAYRNRSSKSDPPVADSKRNAIVQHCQRQLETVFLTVATGEGRRTKMPRSFRETISSIVVNLSKIPVLNSYLLTPTALWKRRNRRPLMTERDVEEAVDDVDRPQQPPPLPIDFLKDFQLLEEYNFRISRLGWSNRTQFEETWMSLLSVLNSGLIDESDTVSSTNSFAIKAATALLARTLYYPPTGKNSAALFHVSRDPPIVETDTKVRKLRSIQDKFESSLRRVTVNFAYGTATNVVTNVFSKPNIEKPDPNAYSCGQICVAYLSLPSKVSTEGNDDEDDDDDDRDSVLRKLYNERRAALIDSNLDLNSCIQSLVDLYSQWFRSVENRPQSTKILNEILKSIVVVSDLFQHRSQFQWMLDTCVEYAKNPLLENDTTLYQYLIVGICKGAAILNPDMEIYELIKKILAQYAKSSNVSVRIACLYGLLYVLEGCVLSNTMIGGGLSDELQLILPIAIDYVDEFRRSAANEVSANKSENQEHDLTVWALTFFIVENVHEGHLPFGFVDSAIVSLISSLKRSNRTTMDVYSSLMKALERVIIKRCVSADLREQILKFAIEKTKENHAIRSLLGVQLMISCMYTDYADIRRSGDGVSAGYSDDNPDNLVRIVEKISIVFDRIKKGLPFQVEVLCRVLPDVINDFFSPADILTKVVGEYLSPQQKYPALLGRIVFEVFENGIAQSQIPLLQDWVVVSLSNFIQTFSTGMATWYLTCFFISTSTNFWLRSVFPRVRSRIGRLEYEDRLMLCVAGRNFYDGLTTDSQRRIFIDTFRKAKEEGGQQDSPFNDLLECL